MSNKPKAKHFGALALSNVLAWLMLSPRVATRLYTKKLFDRVYDPDERRQLEEYSEHENSSISFKASDGSMLQGWFFQHPTSDKVFLSSMGRSCRIGGALEGAKLMLAAGGSVFAYEYRGFGSTPGRPTIDSICKDGLAAYDYLVNARGVEPRNIIIYGRSLGAAVASFVSARRESAGLVLLSGFYSLDKVAKETISALRIYPAKLFPKNRLDNGSIVKGIHPPLLIMHGTKDEVIDYSHAERLYAAASGPKTLVPLLDSGHEGVYQENTDTILKALKQLLSQTSNLN